MASERCGIVIGGSGLVGGAITYHYHNKCENIHVLAPNSKKLNLRSPATIHKYFEQECPDFLINTAIASLGHDTEGTYEINYLGSLNLANVALALNIPYIHMSSAAVLRSGGNVKEQERLHLSANLGDYAKSKLMTELTLEHLHRHYGLDYTIVRLGIVYGKHDYKIKGLHRLLFSIAAGTLPVILTRRGVFHSYTNLRKIPLFVEYIVNRREKFSGKCINFVDSRPVELSPLILAIRKLMNRKRPHNLHLPLPMAKSCIALVDRIKVIMAKIGVESTMPAELSFLESMYESQVLNTDYLDSLDFADPWPEQTLITELPSIVKYYLQRWEGLGLLDSREKHVPQRLIKPADYFAADPTQLIERIHQGALTPYESVNKNTIAKPATPENSLEASPTTKCHKR
ncbi:MAG: NAD-dependent epimerase/dehydratase family protein [Desulfocapsaceae bacterium]|nr:NAD-dependent epimerase/dehydratase family protein [Desulfocapsaceae bacterium]